MESNLIQLFFQYEKNLNNQSLDTLLRYAQEYNGNDWKEYISFSDIGYQRRRIIAGNQVEILILSWKKGQCSKIHDHPENGCILKVLSGKIKEKRYSKRMELEKEHVYQTDQISYIDNLKHYHSIEPLEDTVSLHIYSPPFYKPTYYTSLSK